MHLLVLHHCSLMYTMHGKKHIKNVRRCRALTFQLVMRFTFLFLVSRELQTTEKLNVRLEKLEVANRNKVVSYVE